ncbi:hypothetical protein LCGC14_2034040 [marine sediment metagenome]|uniref:Uncharacterized protein n=1 Tax=marine sediment metagenome TaxID=412755 RepID=A0A0F9ETS0_9ZZZZ
MSRQERWSRESHGKDGVSSATSRTGPRLKSTRSNTAAVVGTAETRLRGAPSGSCISCTTTDGVRRRRPYSQSSSQKSASRMGSAPCLCRWRNLMPRSKAPHSHYWKRRGELRYCRCGAQKTPDGWLVLSPEHVEELRTVWLRPEPMPDWAYKRLWRERADVSS